MPYMVVVLFWVREQNGGRGVQPTTLFRSVTQGSVFNAGPQVLEGRGQ